MTVIASLNRMQREAAEQIRNGSHNEFLVGFLTTSTMLELSNLAAADLDVAGYAQAAADVITQLAPIDRCSVHIDPNDFPTVVASVGTDAPLRRGGFNTDSSEFALEDQATGAVVAADMPHQLRDANFLALAAGQVAAGLAQILEAERRRRRAAVANTLALIAALTDSWAAPDLDALAANIALLPGACGATVTAGASRLAGVLTAEAGRETAAVLERGFKVDDRLDVTVTVSYLSPPASDQAGQLDEIITVLASNMTRIEENIRLAAEAETDQLTGLGNRRRVAKALAAARAMADRRGEKFAVLLVDLDHFKSVNDQFGHAVGDAVLVAFTEMLTENVRTFDTVVRWGGEEFLVICSGCDASEATTIADRILAECPAACAGLFAADRTQTASIGIAVYPDVSTAPEALISAADAALYAAKRDGRNRSRRAGLPAHA